MSAAPDAAAAAAEQRSQGFVSDAVPDGYDRLLAPVVFEPWAARLVAAVGVSPGDRVLDVASGTGAVARAAALAAGAGGAVVASDLSAAMLARSATHPAAGGAAPISFLEVAAEALEVEPGSFEAVLCQQGIQFFPDRPGALARMLAALVPGGRAGVSVWDARERLLPFDRYTEALSTVGAPEPFPGAFIPERFRLEAGELLSLLTAAGFAEVTVSAQRRVATFASVDDAVAAIGGTPFSPLVASLESDARSALDAELRRVFGAPGALDCPQVALFGLARAPVQLG